MPKRGYRTIRIALANSGEAVNVYTSARIADALEGIAGEVSVFHGVKLLQLLEAVYMQGKKDGARDVFQAMDQSIATAKVGIPHLNPGRPARKRSSPTRKSPKTARKVRKKKDH